MVNNFEWIAKIKELKEKKNAIILAHYYQIPEIQDLADFIGDSLALAQKAYEVDADLIVFCGVHFMAETAKILNPSKKVILPDMEAGCSLADSCAYLDFKQFKEQYPEHKVISYINCSAAIKTLTDVVCTSSNAVHIVESFGKEEKIIFAPDKNLGAYINKITGREMVLWNGTCDIHDRLKTEEIIQLKIANPSSKLIAHPECKAPVLALADFVGSTTAMLNYTKEDKSTSFIVATETGILHQMKKDSPEKEFLIVPEDKTCSCNDCHFMKMNTLEKLYQCMLTEMPEIQLENDTIEKAKTSIIRMLELSKK